MCVFVCVLECAYVFVCWFVNDRICEFVFVFVNVCILCVYSCFCF